jgi:exosortase E/protease (VPEID-CTERM system)
VRFLHALLCGARCAPESMSILGSEIRQVSSAVTPQCSVDSPRHSVALRSCCAIAVLVVEVLLFTVQFDSGVFDRESSSVLYVMASLPQFIQFFLFSVAVAVLFGGNSWKDAILEADARQHRRLELPSGILVHLLAVAAFYLVSTKVFHYRVEYPAILIAGWLTLGVATCLSALRLILPIHDWLNVFVAKRKTLFAGFGIGAAALAAGELARMLWDPLAEVTFDFVQLILTPFDVVATTNSTTRSIATESFGVRIAPSCSGLEGIGLIATFLFAYLWFFRRSLRFPAAWLTLPIGIVGVWLANALRISALIVIGHFGSPEIAVGGFHSQTGSLLFAFVGFGVVLVSRTFWSSETPLTSAEELFASPTAAYLMPMLVLLATSMMTAAISASFDYWYPFRIIAVAATLWVYRRHYERWWTWTPRWHAVACGLLVFGVWLGLESIVASPAARPAALSEWTAPALIAWLAFRVFGSVIVVSIAEELAFRGFAGRRMINPDFQSVPMTQWTWLTWIVPSVAFGLLHGERWIAGVVAGLIFAAAAHRRGHIGDAVAAHAVANLLVAAYVLTSGDWSMWI